MCNGQRGRLRGTGEDGRCGPWEFAVHENGSDAGRSRLTFRPLACCSRGAFINSSVLIPWIDEWPPIAIPRAHCPLLLPTHPSRINSTSRRIWTQFPPRKFPFMYPPSRSASIRILLTPATHFSQLSTSCKLSSQKAQKECGEVWKHFAIKIIERGKVR